MYVGKLSLENFQAITEKTAKKFSGGILFFRTLQNMKLHGVRYIGNQKSGQFIHFIAHFNINVEIINVHKVILDITDVK